MKLITICLFFQSFQKVFLKSFQVICITGTNGKSSTCHLLNQILLNIGYKSEIGGNYGKSVLSLNPLENGSKIIETAQAEIAKVIRPDISALVNFL